MEHFTISGGGDPVTLAEAKAQLRVLHANEDDLIERMISAASRHVENRIGRNLVKRTVTYKREGFPRCGTPIVLPRPPVISVTSLTFNDMQGDATPMSSDDYFLAANLIEYWLVPKKPWPQAARGFPSVSIVYESGYGAAASEVPDDLRHAVLLLVQHFYAHRSAVMEGSAVLTPMAVDALIEPHKTTGWI